MTQLTPEQLNAWLLDSTRPKPVLVDVREAWEVGICKIPGSLHIPLGTVPARAGELSAQSDTVLVCHHGARSMQAGVFLEHQGFDKIYNLSGGVNAWAHAVDNTMPIY